MARNVVITRTLAGLSILAACNRTTSLPSPPQTPALASQCAEVAPAQAAREDARREAAAEVWTARLRAHGEPGAVAEARGVGRTDLVLEGMSACDSAALHRVSAGTGPELALCGGLAFERIVCEPRGGLAPRTVVLAHACHCTARSGAVAGHCEDCLF